MNRTTAASILAMIVCFVVCVSQIWKHVPDPTIDFGRETYVAWRVSEGEPLYTHLTYINAPLSPYVNALVFKVAGSSLNVLKGFNTFLAAIDLAMIYLLCRRLSDDVVAAICGISWCILFGFGIFLNDPTFNFITPYSHDLTHGFTLALGMMLMLASALSPKLPRPVLGERAGERGESAGVGASSESNNLPLTPTLSPEYKGEGVKALAIAGLLLGLVLLTKPEVIIASLAAAGVSFLLQWRRLTRRHLAIFVVAVMLPPIVAWVLLSLKIGSKEAFLGILGGFKWVSDRRLTDMPLYKWVSGTDQTGANILSMLKWAGIWAGLVAAIAGIAVTLRKQQQQTVVIVSVVAFVAIFGGLFWQQKAIPWPSIFRGLPVIVGVMILCTIWKNWRSTNPDVLPLMCLVFALAMMAKLALAVRITHYGFVLVAPACLFTLAVALGPLAKKFGFGSIFFRAAILGAWAMVIYMYAITTNAWTEKLKYRIDTPNDGSLCVDLARSRPIGEFLTFANREIAPSRTLSVIPDGALMSFLLRRVNPTGHTVIVPGELLMFGEQRITDDCIRAKPDYILFTESDSRIQNARYFGQDYALPLAKWIDANYSPVRQFGEKPFTTGKYGLLLLRRKDLKSLQSQDARD